MNRKQLVPARPHMEKLLKSPRVRFFYEEERAKTEIARLVRTAREKAGLSQRELAKRAETSQAVIARLELGTDQRMPSLGLISRLLRAAGAKLELRCTFDDVA